MALVINTNIGSLQAERALGANRGTMENAMQRLASGKRINSAADDAAGVAVAARMSNQIQGLNMAIRNANDGISLAQTAEGAIEEMQNVLERLRELAIQSSNDTYTEDDRSYLNAEFTALLSELRRTSSDTAWDGDLKVLARGSDPITVQVGMSGDTGIDIPLGDLSNPALGLSTEATRTATRAASVDTAGSETVKEVQKITPHADSLLTTNTTTLRVGTCLLTGTPAAATIAGLVTALQADADYLNQADFTIEVASGAIQINYLNYGVQKTLPTLSAVAVSGGADVATASLGLTQTFTPASYGLGTDLFLTMKGSPDRRINVENALNIADLVAKIQADFNYSASPITVAASGSNLVITWKSASLPVGKVTVIEETDAVSCATRSQAVIAIGLVDSAQNTTNKMRSGLGAAQNRIEFTINNLMNVVQNTQEAKSRIVDTDYAAESAALARTQVLAQAGTAMLAQANQSSQYVLNLLK